MKGQPGLVLCYAELLGHSFNIRLVQVRVVFTVAFILGLGVYSCYMQHLQIDEYLAYPMQCDVEVCPLKELGVYPEAEVGLLRRAFS